MNNSQRFTEHFCQARTALKKLIELNCDLVLSKRLSPRNDNSKNQIYLGGDLTTFQKIPGVVQTKNVSTSRAKPLSSAGELILTQKMNFYWLDPNGLYKAPHTKLIYYLQYPEIRMSGFLQGAIKSPEALRVDKVKSFDNRVLLLGIKGENVFGVILCGDFTKGIDALLSRGKGWNQSEVLSVLHISNDFLIRLDPSRLVQEIKSISAKGLLNSVSLKNEDSSPEPFFGNQGAGYTLEAHLGISRNGISAPDKYGFEVKTYKTPPITLITTEPDFGVRVESGLYEFLRQFGWPGKKKDGSLRFNGKHTALGKAPKDSVLQLKLHCWDFAKNEPLSGFKPFITLETRKSQVAAGWSFEKIG